ncbi:class I fructose-bisphosphate aldolase [Thermofilum pendens]|uniref:Fructose-bisphosphate aldolase n=1 Tax=Thermofilum pendens (strain DSM 2475 / Hrk 5) TaxID=368408 RepID=A1RYF8_THEPD|nr:fructose-bisphosphate aldolase [Thermofilum pendens]ABL78238.1 fructose-bisphosphate aldolase [Thermofilum pendens Hrk 5]
MTGKAVRIKRLFRDGKALIVALDHGRRHGPIPGLEDLGKTLSTILQARPDAVMVTPAMIERYYGLLSEVFIVARIDGTGAVKSLDETDDRLISSVKRAVRAGADAVSVMVYPGSRNEQSLWEKLARVAEEAEDYGVPVMAEVVPKPPQFQEYGVDVVAYASRIAVELGADIVKTVYRSGFSKVTQSVPAPVVVLGGQKASLKETLTMVEKAVSEGAAGAAIGRNIFQHEDPAKATEAFMLVIHSGKSSEEALKELGLQ